MKIEVENLTRKYGDKYALNNLSFTLDEPKIYGLLGRNGAGKTTFMNILAGQLLETSGDIFIDGEKPFDNQRLTESVCLIKEGGNFKRDLKVKTTLNVFSMFYPHWDWDLVNELLDVYQLDRNAKIKTMSKGMESALGIIVGLASKAPITVFDEPYIGLDAAARKQFYDILLEEYKKEKRTIIFSTHLIDEVSLLFEEILILQDGELLLQQEADELRYNTCSVSGPKEDVEAFIADKEIIAEKELAGMMTAYIYCDMETANASGLSVEGIPVQELMIYLTDGKQGVAS